MRTPRSSTAVDAGSPSPPPVRGRRAHAGPPADEGPEDTQGVGAESASPRAGRALRPRTVRAKIVCLLMVPVVSLLALCVLGAFVGRWPGVRAASAHGRRGR